MGSFLATPPFPGGCACGRVRYRMERAPMFTHGCHCRDCQRQTGGAFVLNALIETEAITLLAATPHAVAVPTASGQPHAIHRCSRCQVAVWIDHGGRPSLRFLRVGTLDAPDAIAPDVHILTRSKVPWAALPRDAPAFEVYYTASALWPVASLERRRAAMA